MKIEVHLQGGLRKIIDITPGATVGATVGVNVRNPDGTLWVPPATGGDKPVSITSWELILNIPPNVVALAETTTTGLYVVTGAGTSVTRTIAAVSGQTTVSNGSGVSGNPTVGLADVADAGGGVLQKTAFDSKGRRTGSSSATTDDLTEGASNLYFSEGRVYESLKDTLVQGANVTITSDDIDSTITISATGGGGGSPGGANTNVQYNNAGAFAGDATFTFNSTTKALSSPLIWWGKGADIARAATTSIGAATGNFVHLTGTTTITSFGTGTAGQTVHIRFAGAGTLTHNATSLILPGAANITTAANDTCVAISEGGSNWRVVSYTKANGQAVVVAGATVANWTTAISTASPNGTVPVASWTATNAATNVDAAFVAKGNGATVAQVPNSATSGGDKRGIYATDWQKIRGGSFQVASGNYSTIGGGSDNTAQGSYGTVAGGYGNNANQQYATVAGGNVNSAGDHGFVGGGGGNSCVSGAYGAIAGGAENTVDAAYGWIPGGYQATTRGQKGAGARASGQFSTLGDCQGRQLILRTQTFNATQTELTLDGAAATFNNLLRLPDNSCFMVRGHIQARESATGDARQWEFTALIRRGSGAGTTAMNVACTPTSLYNAAGASTWAIAIDADTTNGSLRFRGTGQAAKTIRWQADIYACTELVG